MVLYHSFHNKLKTIYQNGKVNRRVDFLIDSLLRIEIDYFFSYMRRKQLFEINYREVQEEECHSREVNTPPQQVQVRKLTLVMLLCVQ